jgi:1-aminocyclopropane-1-carboxylate deaminase/D-cysteine desulfhydrase-like pyridoxal-dependent ACC family enzyme
LANLEKIHKQKRIRFAGFPTPLQRMPNLSKVLGGPNLLVKRDDMTDLAFGCNKARKLSLFLLTLMIKALMLLSWFSPTVSAWLPLPPGSLG